MLALPPVPQLQSNQRSEVLIVTIQLMHPCAEHFLILETISLFFCSHLTVGNIAPVQQSPPSFYYFSGRRTFQKVTSLRFSRTQNESVLQSGHFMETTHFLLRRQLDGMHHHKSSRGRMVS